MAVHLTTTSHQLIEDKLWSGASFTDKDGFVEEGTPLCIYAI